MIKSTEDNLIIDRIRAGDKDSYEFLVSKYLQKVFRTCMGFLHNEEDAQDLTQDIFIKVFNSLGSYTGKSSFSTWLYRISVNMALNETRKLKIKSLYVRLLGGNDNLYPIADEYSDKHVLEDEQNIIIRKAIDNLPASQRKAFVLSYYEDLSNKEISEILGVTLKATENLLFRSRSKLHQELRKTLKE